MTPLFAELPYRADATVLFDGLAHAPWSLFFDSGCPHTAQGRYDILCADPVSTVVSRNGRVEVRGRDGRLESACDLFTAVRQWLGQESSSVAPFCGGAAGYIGYDFGLRLEGLSVPPSVTPEAMLGIYDWAVVVDHLEQRAWMAGLGRDPRTHELWHERLAQFHTAAVAPPLPFAVRGPLHSDTEFDDYSRAFERVQRYIREGDCYQVNLARRFTVPVSGSPWAAYRRLRVVNPAPFSAYLNFPELQVLSASPERFLSLAQGRVVTQPIKGTRPRASDPLVDAALAAELRESAKDRAENLMIVDLLRNDLGKACATGSVAVPKLFEVESFATVHHLVSTVTGTLAKGRDALDLLAGCLPGGSITGAPKRRAMEIIDELEPHRRELYCGAIGYIGADGRMDTNVAIRTLIHSHGEMRFWSGGGIVADSQVEAEFNETEHKAAGMRRLFGVEEL